MDSYEVSRPMGAEKMEQLVLPNGFKWYQQVGSTNKLALDYPDANHGLVLAANSQTEGRGRLGRAWWSPVGVNLYFSLILFPSVPMTNWGGYSLATGIGLAEALESLNIKPQLKWPNDLLLNGRKCGGILLEAKGSRLVVGVGLNVNQDQFPPDLVATSLKLATERSWVRDTLLKLIVQHITHRHEQWGKGKQDISAWRRFDILIDRSIKFKKNNQVYQGVAKDITQQGELLVQDQKGTMHQLNSGEVTLSGVT